MSTFESPVQSNDAQASPLTRADSETLKRIAEMAYATARLFHSLPAEARDQIEALNRNESISNLLSRCETVAAKLSVTVAVSLAGARD